MPSQCNDNILLNLQGIRENLRVSNYPLLPMSFHEIDELDTVKDERRLAIDLVMHYTLNITFIFKYYNVILYPLSAFTLSLVQLSPQFLFAETKKHGSFFLIFSSLRLN